jgi:hypothetical protein
MEEFNIHLTYNPDHFREIYYRNGQGNIFTHKSFRNAIIIPIVLLVITAIIYLISNKFPGISWLIGVGLVVILGATVYAIIAIIKYTRWKASTEAYLKELSQYKSYNLSVTANAIEVALDSKIVIEKWENIKSAIIETDYMLLRNQSGPAYIFPAKAMKTDEFEKLKEFIKIKIKH